MADMGLGTGINTGLASTDTCRDGAAAPQQGTSRVLIIIPCFNEEASVGGLLSEIAATGCGYHTLVVDDGSSDATAAVASCRSPVARLAQNLGIGGAVQTGIKYAARQDFDFCIQIDGDGQHDPRAIEMLLDAHRKDPTNITIGSRFIDHTGFCSTRMRRAGIRLIVLALNGLFRGGGRITDPTSGMRLLDRSAIAFFAKAYPADFPEPISLAWAMRAGLTVSEVPVEMRARETGVSSIDGLKSASYMIRVLGYILLARLVRAS
ncbi:glycosyltransferase involved in cell wall biosynthesis [Bradyrhizobium japonicum USDA 38]|nr:glycosyltransferase involved in cell wall biosynthesis [Bradyrhizobium japonicum USDA 38]MCS3941862.1 glycosyltransferase involved in cell wall biosynthesis [Bradyrhizobium japonicum]MCW2225530.1 glycosyltransferase involved in cell wall biosynthesis [Bradyrhizobium japonicum]MCW2340742.1 glycosyltransferase involved in cell wall biosynthesis [Bradyrhizobium japonicum]